MREFTWKVFTLTGDIDAYMLFKEHEKAIEYPEEEFGEPLEEPLELQ